jgi:hypothetical protein
MQLPASLGGRLPGHRPTLAGQRRSTSVCRDKWRQVYDISMDRKPRRRRIAETEFTRLYHYEKFKAEHLSSALRDMRLHCSDPANFNDPWDCDPWFDEKSLENPEILEKVFVYQRKTTPNVLPEKDLLF